MSTHKIENYVLISLFSVQWRATKAILIGVSMTAINLFSGTFAMVNYTAIIFKESGSTIDSQDSSIIVAVIEVLGVACSLLLVDRIGRKSLLIISTTGAFIGLFSLGVFSYLHENNYDLTQFNLVPLLSFSTFIFIGCLGIVPLPFIVINEILPVEVKYMTYELWKKTYFFSAIFTHVFGGTHQPVAKFDAILICLLQVRKFGSMFCMLTNSIFAFISLKTFPVLMNAVCLYGVAWICAGVCVYGILFSIFILTETKGKNLNEYVPKNTPTTST